MYVLNSHYVDTGIQKAPLHSKIQLNIFIHKKSLLILLLHKHKKGIYETSVFLKTKYAIKSIRIIRGIFELLNNCIAL